MACLLNTDKKLLLLFIVMIMFGSCQSIKNYDYKHVECQMVPREAVNIAIADYSKQLKKRKDISRVVAVHVRIHCTTTDWFYISMLPWQLHIDDDSGEYYLTDRFSVKWLDENMGKVPPDWIPSDYMEMDGILYTWHDPQVVMTEDFKSVLSKYNLLHYPEEDSMIVTLDGSYISYIFCKANYKNKYYRKVKAQYNTPLPLCGCK